MAPRQGPDQARRRRVANAISKKWKIERQSKRPRGLVNIGNNCYRHGALQPLLHLPRFVNWIKKHNRGNHWPCHANDPNRVLPSDPLTLQLLEDEIGKLKKKKGRKKDDEEAACALFLHVDNANSKRRERDACALFPSAKTDIV